jgi:DNA-binding response OmpR family regulator
MDEVKKPTPSEVLLLEDEEATASAVSQSLTERNFNVYQATSIDEAIRAASSRHVGFVVLDVPVGADQTKNVIEAARGIQELQPNSPIAVISALSNNPDFRRDAEQSGVRVAQWLSKPLDVRQIVRLIESKAEQVKVPNLEEQNTAQADSLTDSESPHHTIFRFPFNRLSANSLDAIRRAERFRQTKGRNEIRLEHLVVGLCDAKRGQASKAFDRAPMSRDQLREALEQVGGTDIPGAVPYTPQRTNSPPLSWDVFDVLKRALPAGYGEVIFTEDLLRAALTVPGNKLSEFLREHTPIGEVLGLRGSVSPPSALSDGDTNAAPTRSASEGSRDSILFASARDQPTKEDHLGFEPYVWAIAEFLASPDTKPPLTLSIEGDWGSGKSSFMLQLEERLRARGDPFEGERRLYRRLWRLLRSSRKEWINCGRWLLPPCCFAVRFNAWRHDKEEALWAAFALEFLHSIAGERFFLRRWWGHLQLFKDRYRWRNGWFDLVRWFGVWSFLFLLAVAAPLYVWL